MTIKNLTITQGSSFELLALINDVNGTPLDMTTYTGGTAGARAKIRKKYTDAAALVSFTVSILDHNGVIAAITAGTCHLTTSEINSLQPQLLGKCYLLIRLSATDTAGLAKTNGVWDCEIEDTTGYVFKPYTGTVTIQPEATK